MRGCKIEKETMGYGLIIVNLYQSYIRLNIKFENKDYI